MVVKRSGPARVSRIRRAKNQVAVPRQDAHVIAVLVERMLPASLSDNPQQHQFTGMHVRIAVVRLMRIFRSIVRIHEIRHGASVDHEVRRNIWLGSNRHATGAGSEGLLLGLAVDPRIHFGKLEQILAVVAGAWMVVRSSSQAEVILTPVALRRTVGGVYPGRATGGNGRGQDNDCPVKAHFHLQVALRAAVVGVGAGVGGGEGIGHGTAMRRLSG